MNSSGRCEKFRKTLVSIGLIWRDAERILKKGIVEMGVALELTPADLKRYRAAARRRAAVRTLTPADAAAREDLLQRVRSAAEVLRTRYGAKRVILFGSLAHEAWYVADSDVDLAVEGLAGDTVWRAWRAVEEIVGDRPVDLVEMETASESLRSAIERTGVPL